MIQHPLRNGILILLSILLVGVVASGATAAAGSDAVPLQTNTDAIEPSDIDDGSINVVLEPTDEEVTVDSETTYEVIVQGADNGISSYSFRVETSDTGTAAVTDATLEEFGGAFSSIDIADDGSSVFFEEAVGDQDPAGENFTIATVTLAAGEQPGVAEISIADDIQVEDNDANQYAVETTDATLSVVEHRVDVVIDPATDEVEVGSEATYDVVVDGATNDVSSYDFTVQLGDGAVAEITDAELVEFGGPLSNVSVAEDGSSVSFEEAVGDQTADGEEFTIATITLTASETGDTEIAVSDDATIADTDGEAYSLETTDATLSVVENQVDVVFEPTTNDVQVGSEITYEVVVDGVDNDVSAYDFTIALGDITVAEISDAELVAFGGALGDVSITEDGSSVSFEEAVGDQNIDSEEFTIATVTVSGTEIGETTLTVNEDATIADDDGDEYMLDLSTATVTVTEELEAPDVTGDGNPATDTTGDGLLNDVNGDGDFDIFDIQALFQHRNSEVVQNNTELFDFTGDGDVDIFDAQELFNLFRAQN